jgi:hypothetical protein
MLVGGRYALADWGKIPLNPTILGEYSFGIGKRYPVQPGENQESEAGNDQSDVAGRVKRVTKTNIPDAYEVRLLLGQQIGKYIEFACNGIFDQSIGGDREQEIGFSTAASYAIRGEALKIGLETSYRNVSQHGQRRNSKNIFELGPSFTIKPSPHTRFDLAPLFGTTSDSPHLELFAIFSVFSNDSASKRNTTRHSLPIVSEAARISQRREPSPLQLFLRGSSAAHWFRANEENESKRPRFHPPQRGMRLRLSSTVC